MKRSRGSKLCCWPEGVLWEGKGGCKSSFQQGCAHLLWIRADCVARRDGEVLWGGGVAPKPACPCLNLCPSPFYSQMFPWRNGSSSLSLQVFSYIVFLWLAQVGSIPQILWGFFWMFLIKCDCSGLSRQQSNFPLSLEEAEGCLLLWAALFVLSVQSLVMDAVYTLIVTCCWDGPLLD